MRLLNVNTLEFGLFLREYTPPYGILSHTWAKDEEISYTEFLKICEIEKNQSRRLRRAFKGPRKWPRGYAKIVAFCNFIKNRQVFCLDWIREDRPQAFSNDDQKMQAGRREALQWVWIDTCCIDNTNSMEVSEAINSMWWWYWFAEECYIYLFDFPDKPLDQCRWFKRGWTLQELLASGSKVFLSSDWKVYGKLSSYRRTFHNTGFKESGEELIDCVSRITMIPQPYICGQWPVKRASIAQRLSWAVGRDTTRVEDRGYCLIGLLGVSMPLLYGEGRRAFFRLQEDIIKTTDDLSILFWQFVQDDLSPISKQPVGMLAPHIGCFRNSSGMQPLLSVPGQHFSVKNTHLKVPVQLRLVAISDDTHSSLYLAELGQPLVISNNAIQDKVESRKYEIAILHCRHNVTAVFYRSRCNDYIAAGDFHGIFPDTEKGQSDRIYVRKVSFVDEQCEKCAGFDEALVERLQAGGVTSVRLTC